MMNGSVNTIKCIRLYHIATKLLLQLVHKLVNRNNYVRNNNIKYQQTSTLDNNTISK